MLALKEETIERIERKSINLDRERLITIVSETEGIENVEIFEDRISCFDDYDFGRCIELTFTDCIDYDSLFQFNSLSVDKEKFYRIFEKYVGMEQILSLRKIIFFNSEDELEEILNDYPDQSFNMGEMLGIYWYMDSVILVNVVNHKELAKELCDDFYNEQQEYNIGLWTTLFHEIKHADLSMPFIYDDADESVNDDSEEYVEEYCRQVMDSILFSKEDYICFY